MAGDISAACVVPAIVAVAIATANARAAIRRVCPAIMKIPTAGAMRLFF
jgi:hypothetical protein